MPDEHHVVLAIDLESEAAKQKDRSAPYTLLVISTTDEGFLCHVGIFYIFALYFLSDKNSPLSGFSRHRPHLPFL